MPALLHIGVGRTTKPSPALDMNLDVHVMGTDYSAAPNLNEKTTYRIRATVRNAGNDLARSVCIEAWWSPPNLTGTSMTICTAKSLIGSTYVPARTPGFSVNPQSSKESGDMRWEVPDFAEIAPGGTGLSYKLIIKVFNSEDLNQQPDANVSPYQDPRCGVHCINIVGV